MASNIRENPFAFFAASHLRTSAPPHLRTSAPPHLRTSGALTPFPGGTSFSGALTPFPGGTSFSGALTPFPGGTSFSGALTPVLRTCGSQSPVHDGIGARSVYRFFFSRRFPADEKGNFTKSRSPPAGEKLRISRLTPAMSSSTTSCSFASPSSCTTARRWRE